jgi:hypothetical protein
MWPFIYSLLKPASYFNTVCRSKTYEIRQSPENTAEIKERIKKPLGETVVGQSGPRPF